MPLHCGAMPPYTTPTPDRPSPAESAGVEPGPVIVVVEDEPDIRRFLRASLLSKGYRLVEAATGREGLEAAETRQPDLIILDLGLPDVDGLEVIRRVREWSLVPIIVLSAKGQETTKVAALDAGADDYIAKPFGVSELLARMRVSLRHAARSSQGEPTPVFTTGELQIDLAQRRAWGIASWVRKPSLRQLGARHEGPEWMPRSPMCGSRPNRNPARLLPRDRGRLRHAQG